MTPDHMTSFSHPESLLALEVSEVTDEVVSRRQTSLIHVNQDLLSSCMDYNYTETEEADEQVATASAYTLCEDEEKVTYQSGAELPVVLVRKYAEIGDEWLLSLPQRIAFLGPETISKVTYLGVYRAGTPDAIYGQFRFRLTTPDTSHFYMILDANGFFVERYGNGRRIVAADRF